MPELIQGQYITVPNGATFVGTDPNFCAWIRTSGTVRLRLTDPAPEYVLLEDGGFRLSKNTMVQFAQDGTAICLDKLGGVVPGANAYAADTDAMAISGTVVTPEGVAGGGGGGEGGGGEAGEEPWYKKTSTWLLIGGGVVATGLLVWLAMRKKSPSTGGFGDMTQLLNAISGEGFGDEETGSVTESGRWYGLVRGPLDPEQMAKNFPAEWASLDGDEKKEAATAAGFILTEDSQGFKDSSVFTDQEELDQTWAEIEEEQAAFYREEEEA